MCDFIISPHSTFAVINVSVPNVLFFAIPQRGREHHYTLRKLSSSKDAGILRKRLPQHGFDVDTYNIPSSDTVMACIASQVFEFGPAVPFLSPPNRRVEEQYVGYIYDDILESELNFFTLLEKRLINNHIFISNDSINPALFPILDDMDTFLRIDTILLPSNSSSAARYALRAKTMKFRAEFLGRNLSLEEYGLLSGMMYASFDSNKSKNDSLHFESDEKQSIAISSFDGQDARILALPTNGFALIYTLPYPPNIVMPGLSTILPDSDGNIVFSSSVRIYPPEWPQFSGREKNWSPFIHEEKIYFVKSINPLVVVSFNYSRTASLQEILSKEILKNYVNTYTVSTSKYISGIDWGHKHLRGGSEAHLIDDKFYLSFFHTQTHFEGSGLATYFFGAYTFSAKAPFTLLGLSRFPIIEKALYTGKWNKRFPRRKIDYVVFPMSFFIKASTIYVTVGHQDEYGYLLTLHLSDVLLSLRNVTNM